MGCVFASRHANLPSLDSGFLLQKFPELKFKYVEEEQPEEFFIPYVWSLVYNSAVALYWNPRDIQLFTMDSGWGTARPGQPRSVLQESNLCTPSNLTPPTAPSDPRASAQPSLTLGQTAVGHWWLVGNLVFIVHNLELVWWKWGLTHGVWCYYQPQTWSSF